MQFLRKRKSHFKSKQMNHSVFLLATAFISFNGIDKFGNRALHWFNWSKTLGPTNINDHEPLKTHICIRYMYTIDCAKKMNNKKSFCIQYMRRAFMNQFELYILTYILVFQATKEKKKKVMQSIHIASTLTHGNCDGDKCFWFNWAMCVLFRIPSTATDIFTHAKTPYHAYSHAYGLVIYWTAFFVHYFLRLLMPLYCIVVV